MRPPVLCDNELPKGWYRFVGAAGTKMPTTRVPAFRCGTVYSGWLHDPHPTMEDGEVFRRVCFSDKGSSCQDALLTSVKNCGSYYIYKLFRPPSCPSRYCGSDWNVLCVIRGFIIGSVGRCVVFESVEPITRGTISKIQWPRLVVTVCQMFPNRVGPVKVDGLYSRLIPNMN